jgi:hypothetical protein
VVSFDEIGRIVLRNKLLGRWAAEKLSKVGDGATAYADALGASGIENGDVFSLLRRDFDAAGVALSDDEISDAITRCTVQAGTLLSGPRGGGSDAAALALKRKLTSR